MNFATSNEKFFQAINYSLKDFEDENNKVPLNWHSKYIINNKNQLDIKYLKNDFEKLYEEILIEENNYLNELKKLCILINIREEMNLNCAENAIENMKFFTDNLEKAKKIEKVKIFIIKDRTEICITLKDNKKVRLEESEQEENSEIKYIDVKPADKCIHLKDKFFGINQKDKYKNINSHSKSVNELIYKLISKKGSIYETIIKYIKEDIQIGNASHKIYTLFSQYKEILKKSLLKNFQELIEDNQDPNEIMETLEDYILKKIYKYVFPKKPLDEDISFEKLTKSFNELNANNFLLKDNLNMEDIKDSIYYIKLMEEKSNSVNEKIKCLKMVYNNMNKINQFYFDISDMSIETQSPIFYYIIVKSQPKRFISNINYLKCFTCGKDLGKDQIFIDNCQAALEFIYNNKNAFK